MATDEERGIGLARDAVDRVRLLRLRKVGDFQNRRVRTVERHVEVTVPVKAVASVPPGLMPPVGDVDPEAFVSAGVNPGDVRPEVMRELLEELPVRADNEPAGSRSMAIAVTVAIEEPLHHRLRRRDDLRESERLGLALRASFRHAEPPAELPADVARDDPDSIHRDRPPEEPRHAGHALDLRSCRREGLAELLAVPLGELLAADGQIDPATILDAAVGGSRPEHVAQSVAGARLLNDPTERPRIDPLHEHAGLQLLGLPPPVLRHHRMVWRDAEGPAGRSNLHDVPGGAA